MFSHTFVWVRLSRWARYTCRAWPVCTSVWLCRLPQVSADPAPGSSVGALLCVPSSTAPTSWPTGVFTTSAPTTTTCAASSPET